MYIFIWNQRMCSKKTFSSLYSGFKINWYYYQAASSHVWSTTERLINKKQLTFNTFTILSQCGILYNLQALFCGNSKWHDIWRCICTIHSCIIDSVCIFPIKRRIYSHVLNEQKKATFLICCNIGKHLSILLNISFWWQ